MAQLGAAWEYFVQVAVNISGGLNVTLGLFGFTILLSIPLGLLVSLGAMSSFKPLSWLVKGYIWILRGTPLLLQLMFVYFGLPMLFQINIDNFTAAVIAFVLNYAAYFAEIFRAGIQSIDKGQFEAAKALGLSGVQTMWKIIIPQTVSRILPPGRQRGNYARKGYLACIYHRSVRHLAARHIILLCGKRMLRRLSYPPCFI